MPLLTLQSVRQYYEQNTRLFSFFGGSNKAKSIHRAIWFPEVQDLKQALTASNRLILNEIQDLILKDPISQLHLIDLGCGIGGTLFYLINHIPLPAMAAGYNHQSCASQAGSEPGFERNEPAYHRFRRC